MSENGGNAMDPVTKMLVNQESMRGDIRELSAIVKAHMEKVGREVEVLFADRKEHAKQIGHIRETFATKEDFARLKDTVDSTRVRVTVIVGIASAIVTGLTLYARFM